MAKIYVGNLPFSASEADVRTLFAQHGTVESVSLPTDRETGRPRGFGFRRDEPGRCGRAIQSLKRHDMGGSVQLRVNEAQDKPRTGGGGGDVRAAAVAAASVVVNSGGGGGGGRDRW